MERWNPWRDLRAREHIVFRRARLDGRAVGLYIEDGTRTEIVLDDRLLRRERLCVLAHELVHDERGGAVSYVGQPDAWQAVARREELRIDREVARRLVPRAQLARWVGARLDADLPVTAEDVAEEFDVARWVALEALKMLAGR
jgi:hypothetical protein